MNKEEIKTILTEHIKYHEEQIEYAFEIFNPDQGIYKGANYPDVQMVDGRRVCRPQEAEIINYHKNRKNEFMQILEYVERD